MEEAKLHAILEAVAEKYRGGAQVMLQTNGDLLDGRRLDALLERGVSRFDVASIDRPGVRIAVPLNASADAFLSRRLKSAELVRVAGDTNAAGELLRAGRADLYASSIQNGLEIAGRIPGAVHLGKGIIERDIEGRIPDTGAEIVLYCGGGFRSALTADNLQKMGYRNVFSMDGGIRDWRGKGYPLTNS